MMAIAAFVVMLFSSNTGLGSYAGAQKNPDGTWVCGGAYTGAQKNPDGTWVCGGAYTGAQKNPDGTWVVGWKRLAHTIQWRQRLTPCLTLTIDVS